MQRTIRIDEGATVADAETVNGGLRVDDKVRSKSLSTVNGSIDVASDVTVDGDVTAVNGRITLGGGSKVAKDLGNVNGDIELERSEVGGDVSTTNGDVELADGAVIAFGGEAVADDGFAHLIHDIALLHGLGIRVVLVHGARPQIEERLRLRGAQMQVVNGLRVTDDVALQCVKEAAGANRVELEALCEAGGGEEQVAELLAQPRAVVEVDRLGRLVGLLDQVGS